MDREDMQKLKRFASEAMTEAEDIAGQITAELSEKKKNALAENERRVNEEMKNYVEEELKKLRRGNSREVSSRTMELRGEILLKREALLDGVVAEVTQKLREFAESDGYGAYLERLCLRVLADTNDSFTVFLTLADKERYGDGILERLNSAVSPEESKGFTIASDDMIKIGGAKFRSSGGSIYINETLEENLEIQKQHFAAMMISAMSDIRKTSQKRRES